MNTRERCLKNLKFENVDKVINIEIGVWEQTKERWINEGMPQNVIKDIKLFWGNEYFNLDGSLALDIDTWHPYPIKEEKIIEEDEKYIIYIDNIGRKRKGIKSGMRGSDRLSMDQYIDYPVKDRKSFLNHIKEFSGNYFERYPKNYKEIKLNHKRIDKPLYLMNPVAEHFGYYSILRSWMGTERLSYMFFDDPSLIMDALNF